MSPLNGLKKWLTPVEMWQNHQMTLRVGEDIDVDQFLNKLVNMGYKRESVVLAYTVNSHCEEVLSISSANWGTNQN
ncbi:hypothetical protein ACVNPZ_00160 [Staphylococcus aureus]